MGVYEKVYQAQRQGMDEHVCAEQKTRSVGLHEHGLILGTHRSPAHIYTQYIFNACFLTCKLTLVSNSKKTPKIYYNLAYSRISE